VRFKENKMSDTRHLVIRTPCQRTLWVQCLWMAKDRLDKQTEKTSADGHLIPKNHI